MGGSATSNQSPAVLAQTDGAANVGYDGAEATVKLALDALYSSKANLASPTFTGAPAAPTAAKATNNTQLATTSFVHSVAGDYMPLAGGTFSGTVAFENDLALQGENSSGTAGDLLRVYSSDNVHIGPTNSVFNNLYYNVAAGKFHFVRVNNVTIADWSADGLRLGEDNSRVNSIIGVGDTSSDASKELVTKQYVDQAGTNYKFTDISTHTLSADGSVDITLADLGSYDFYRLWLMPLVCSSGVEPRIRVSTDSGATFDSGASDYAFENFEPPNVTSDGAQDYIQITRAAVVAGEPVVGHIDIHYADDAGEKTYFKGVLGKALGTYFRYCFHNSSRLTDADTDTIRLYVGAGTMTGTLILQGANVS